MQINLSNIETKAIKIKKKFTKENRSINSLNSSSVDNLDVSVTNELIQAEIQFNNKNNNGNNDKQHLIKKMNPNKVTQKYKHGSPDPNEDQMRKYLKNNPSASVLVSGKAQLNNINKKHYEK